MSFTNTTIMSKKMYFAFLSKGKQDINFHFLPAGMFNYLFNNSGTAPVYITEGAVLNNTNGIPMACTYVLTGDCEQVMIGTANYSAALFINDTGRDISITNNNSSQIFVLPKGESVFASATTEGSEYSFYTAFVPFGYCTEDLSVKESKGDELNLSHATGFVQSKTIEVILPGFNLFSGNAFIDKIIDNLVDFDYSLFSEYKYIYILSVEPVEGAESTTLAYEIYTGGNSKLDMTVQANQPNKGTLTFNKELAINEAGINVLHIL